MASPGPRAPRRGDALSRERILAAAVAILDDGDGDDGVGGLTLRALTTLLSTGPGAIYHHVATMDQLRAAAADDVLHGPLDRVPADTDPTAALRAVAVAVFDSTQAHGWLGAQLTRDPAQPAVRRIWKALGRQLRRLGLTGPGAAAAGATLTSYVLGSAAQQAAGPRRVPPGVDRAAYLTELAEGWRSVDPDPLVADITAQLRDHDDRDQFLAGVEIILRGITAGEPSR